MSGFSFSTPVFEIRDTAGENNDMLVKSAALGRAWRSRLAATCLVDARAAR